MKLVAFINSVSLICWSRLISSAARPFTNYLRAIHSACIKQGVNRPIQAIYFVVMATAVLSGDLSFQSCYGLISSSFCDGVKGDLNQTLVSLGLVLHMLLVFSDCCLGFFLCCHLVVVSTSRMIGYEDRFFLQSCDWLRRMSLIWPTMCWMGC